MDWLKLFSIVENTSISQNAASLKNEIPACEGMKKANLLLPHDPAVQVSDTRND